MAYRFPEDSRFLTPSEEELPDVLLVGALPTGEPRKVAVSEIPGQSPSSAPVPLEGYIAGAGLIYITGGSHKFLDGSFYTPTPGYWIPGYPGENNKNFFCYGGLISGEYTIQFSPSGFDGDAYNLLPLIFRVDSSGASMCGGTFANNRFVFDITLLRSGTASEYKNTYTLNSTTYAKEIFPAPWPDQVAGCKIWHYSSVATCISNMYSLIYPRGFECDATNRHLIYLDDAFIGSTRTWWLTFIAGTTSVQVAVLWMDFRDV